jgi:hypothetical protein
MLAQNTGISNSLHNLLSESQKDSKFLYDTLDKYIKDAEQDNRSDLAGLWKTIKQEDKNI